MVDRRSVFHTVFSVVMFPAISGLGLAACAQDAEGPAAADLLDRQKTTDEQFDRWVDQIIRDINTQDSPERGRLTERLALKLDWIEQSCKISETQKKKLQVAGRGDIKRLLDELHEIKRRYHRVRSDQAESVKLHRRLGEIQSLSDAELFGDLSLFSKMLQTTLSPLQVGAYARAVEESRAFAHRAAVAQAVQVCDVAVGLKDEQRRRLTELFLAETRPARPEELAELPPQFLMVLKTAKLSRAKLKSIFDERQWIAMSALLKQLERGVRAVGLGAIEIDLPEIPLPPYVPADANDQ